MSSLLLERGLRGADKDSEVSTLARARTVTVLQRLDTNRNQTVIRFLSEARLTGSAIGLLVEADLAGAHLRGSDLNNVDLSQANLSGADLSDAHGITNEELEQQLEQPAKSLEGTTMPSGQKYEDWLKDKEG
jgi:uncharacterized protein YjbI with pentapeptide repeats